MKRYSIILFLLLCCCIACKQEPADIMADIKKKYKEIEAKQKDLTTKRVDDITSSATGTITGYYRDEEVKKILSEHFTDTCRTFTEYFFDDGMVIFILKQNFIYNLPASYTEEKAKANNDTVWYDDKKTRLEISRYFFHKNKLMKWEAPEYDVPANTSEFIDKESELWAETVILLKQLKETPNP